MDNLMNDLMNNKNFLKHLNNINNLVVTHLPKHENNGSWCGYKYLKGTPNFKKFEGNIIYRGYYHTLKNNIYDNIKTIDNKPSFVIYDNINFINKRINIFNLSSKCNTILEIGCNACHSLLLMLYSNPDSVFYCFDICKRPYTIPIFKYMMSEFPNRINLIEGDSTKTLPKFIIDNNIKFDLFHIDGGHTAEILKSDLENCIKISDNSIFIIDDTHNKVLNKIVLDFSKINNLKKKINNVKHTSNHSIYENISNGV